jgi:hypothetical protein
MRRLSDAASYSDVSAVAIRLPPLLHVIPHGADLRLVHHPHVVENDQVELPQLFRFQMLGLEHHEVLPRTHLRRKRLGRGEHDGRPDDWLDLGK